MLFSTDFLMYNKKKTRCYNFPLLKAYKRDLQKYSSNNKSNNKSVKFYQIIDKQGNVPMHNSTFLVKPSLVFFDFCHFVSLKVTACAFVTRSAFLVKELLIFDEAWAYKKRILQSICSLIFRL